MAYDFSQITDSQLEAVMDDLINDPAASMAMPVEQRRATVAEYNRRRSARQPANVASNLEASATPVAVEPVAGEPAALSRPDAYRERLRSAGYRDNEADTIVRAEGRMPYPFQVPESDSALRAAVGRTRAREARQDAFDQSLALAYGHSAPSVNPDPDTVMVDGVEVPAYRLTDGKPFGGMFREGDLRAAQEAAREAQIVDRVSREAQEELQRYGDGSLQFYRYDPQSAENGVLNVEAVSPSERDARFQQIHGRAPTQAERAAYEQQAANLAQRRGMEQRQANQNRMLRPRAAGNVDRQQAWSRDFIRARNLLAGGSQNINSGNVGFWNRLAMLPQEQRDLVIAQSMPINPDRAKIEAARNAQLTELGLRTAQGRGFQELDPVQRDALDRQGDAADVQMASKIGEDATAIVGEYADNIGWNNWLTRLVGGGSEGWDNTLFTVEEEQKAVRRLMAKYPHLSFEQALQYVQAASTNVTRPKPAAGG